MDNTILVVGATGNVGHHLVNLLLEKGENVRAATRHPDTYSVPGANPVLFDYDSPETFAPALEGVKRVFFIVKSADPEPQATVFPFIDKAIEEGVEYMVLLTAFGVDQAEGTGLREVEKYLIHADVQHSILRPNWFMDNFNPGFFLPMIQAGDLRLPAGEAKSSMIAAYDIAEVALRVLTDESLHNREFPLTGGEAISYQDAVDIISDVTGHKVRYTAISDDDARQMLTAIGWESGSVDVMIGLFQIVAQGWTAPVVPTVEQILGRKPITFAEFAKENAGAWKVVSETV